MPLVNPILTWTNDTTVDGRHNRKPFRLQDYVRLIRRARSGDKLSVRELELVELCERNVMPANGAPVVIRKTDQE